MKIECYREQHLLDGVSVLSLSTTELPVAEVLEQRVVDVTCLIGEEGAADESEPVRAAPGKHQEGQHRQRGQHGQPFFVRRQSRCQPRKPVQLGQKVQGVFGKGDGVQAAGYRVGKPADPPREKSGKSAAPKYIRIEGVGRVEEIRDQIYAALAGLK